MAYGLDWGNIVDDWREGRWWGAWVVVVVWVGDG